MAVNVVDTVNLASYGSDQISRLHWAGQTLTVVQQRVRPQPAEDWSMIDAAGHLHSARPGADSFPTLIRVHEEWAEPCETCSDCGDIERYTLSCRECGEKVWPAPGGPPVEYLPGTFLYWIGEERITETEARAFTSSLREGDRERWDRLKGWLKYSAGLAVPSNRVRI